jgi:hypothetical protein
MNMEKSIDIPQLEFSVIVSLNRYGVRYLIVGGYAMLFYGDEDRMVNDLDIWIDNEHENASHCFNALDVIMPGLLNFPPAALLEPGRRIDLRKNHYDVEIFTSMDGAEFAASFSRCRTYLQDGELLYFISAGDLLQIKRKAYESCHERMAKESRDIAFLEGIVDT